MGGGVFMQGPSALVLQNTIVASSTGANCAGSAFSDGGHDLSFGDTTCPGGNGDPKLGPLQENGGPTQTMDLGSGSAALNKVPMSGAGCPATDQRGVTRPQGSGCDIGAFEVARPVAVTGGASRITTRGARLAGAVTANQADASVTFEYGTSTAYGAETSVQHMSGIAPKAVSARVTGLHPNTTYHYRVDATSTDGNRRGRDRTFTTRSVVLVISRVRETNRAWVEGNALPRISSTRKPPVGTTFKFDLNEGASVRLAFMLEQPGRRVGNRCAAPTTSNAGSPACTRLVPAGLLSFAGHFGRNEVVFDGQLSSKRKLKPGSYTLVITARAARQKSRRETLRFTILKQ
jgi:chitodextrinase